MGLKVSSKEEFNSNIANGIVLVDFYADWCGPCKMIAPILEEISQTNPELNIVKINVDNAQEVAAKYSVMSIPTLKIFKNGVEVDTKVGFMPKEQIIEWMKSFE